MLRTRLAGLRFIFYALFALALAVCTFELVLRVQDSLARSRASAESLTSKQRANALSAVVVPSRTTFIEMKPLASVVEIDPDDGRKIEWKTNSLGLRGPEPEIPKPSEVFRIVCLGDERTLAPMERVETTFCARLQVLLEPRTRLRVEVVNAGVPGYCPLLSCLQLKHALLALQPDLVILNFDMSDVADDHRVRRYTIVKKGEPLACPHPSFRGGPSDETVKKPARFLLPGWALEQLRRIPSDSDGSQDRRDIETPCGCYAWTRDHPPDWSMYVEHALEPIGRLNQLAGRSYSRFVVATYPLPWQVSGGASSGGDVRKRAGVEAGEVSRNLRPFEIVGRYAEVVGAPYLDSSAAFRNSPQPARLFQHNARGLSIRGHDLYARELAAFVIRVSPEVWDGGDAPSTPRPYEPVVDRPGPQRREWR